MSYITEFEGVEGCYNQTQFFCATSVFVSFFKNSNFREKCDSLCPLECDSWHYTIQMTQAEYPTPAYVEILKKDDKVLSLFEKNASAITYEAIRSNMLTLAVYYDELGYTLITEEPKTNVYDLISNFGGQLGKYK